MDFLLWSDALFYPEDTFRAEKDHASIPEATKSILVAGLIYGAVTGIIYDAFPNFHASLFFTTVKILRETFQEYFLFFNIFLSPLIFLFLLLTLSFLIFLSARIFKGYGDFTTQTYFLSSLMSPLILFTLLAFVPFIGEFMVIFILIYSLKPLAFALKEAHTFTTSKQLISALSLSLVFSSILSLLLVGISWYSGIIVFNAKNSASGFEHIKVISSAVKYHPEGTFEFEVINTLKKPVILTNLISLGDCEKGRVDFDKNTPKIETFISLDPDQFAEIKISNCTRKRWIKKFSIPLHFQYQEKKIGEELSHVDSGEIKGAAE